jgi:hypothetical protein
MTPRLFRVLNFEFLGTALTIDSWVRGSSVCPSPLLTTNVVNERKWIDPKAKAPRVLCRPVVNLGDDGMVACPIFSLLRLG